MWKQVWKWIRSPQVKRKLFLEAFFFLAWARILKSLPFSRVAPTLGTPMVETPLANDPRNAPILREISSAVCKMSRHTIWESACMVRAVAAMKMLERRGIESTLYLGTSKDHSGKMIAHAWLRSGPIYLTGFEEMKKFTVVAKFGKQLKSNQSRETVKNQEIVG
ncbi:lasso peptide biosynthesis B2 protein [Paenibacillus timonensis]|uniref:Lasso peptide biosynthesis B2 protein n=1 Tax=Paenibacillus timonensis TaxID=225915 RepID=A0ABW3SAL9_9BACL|nr:MULTISPECIES: lasso peptide biosynthesis B2 protein [Paenibacillus]MCH1640130.1 lasso peptide biosynthesis B2 protein [Paenibacillus timonensis]MDU2239837.1 lasso peptide biosynthesis B2 protein [Paenibacillus sp.]